MHPSLTSYPLFRPLAILPQFIAQQIGTVFSQLGQLLPHITLYKNNFCIFTEKMLSTSMSPQHWYEREHIKGLVHEQLLTDSRTKVLEKD